jgi:hypothetical protein
LKLIYFYGLFGWQENSTQKVLKVVLF